MAVVALLCAVACGGSPAASARSSPTSSTTPSGVAAASPSPTASPARAATPPAASLLFAALEAKGTANATQWNTVAIAGLDGYARAKATFKPMAIPYVGCAGAVLPGSAHVAAGKVYFASGDGVIRSLSTHGQVSTVATFPLTSTQQMLSFAVSPDGNRVLGAVFTLPPKPASGNACNGAPLFAPGDFTLDVFSTKAGGARQRLYHQILPVSSTAPVPNVMAFVGWNKLGPFGTYPMEWATQGGGIRNYFGDPVRIDATTGKVLKEISNPNSCLVWDIASSGDYVCEPNGSSAGDISIRRPDGSQIWGVKASSTSGWFDDLLSPLEDRVAVRGSSAEVLCRGGCDVPLSLSFVHEAWLDDVTVVGYDVTARAPSLELAYVGVSAPRRIVDLGFKGAFVGTVQS